MNMFEQMPFSEKYPVFRKLAEIGDLRKLSREELELYDEDIKNMRDIYATRKFDVRQEKLATARRLLSMGLSDEQVATATELPLEEIQKLKEQAWTGLKALGYELLPLRGVWSQLAKFEIRRNCFWVIYW